MNPRELEKAIIELLDGTASDGDASELQEILKSDARAREIYLDHAGLHGALGYRFSRASPSRSDGPEGLSRRGRWRRPLAIGVVAAAAVVFLIALWPGHPPATYTVAPQSRVWVEHAGGKDAGKGELQIGSRVRLDHGTLQLAAADGTGAIIEGPADFSLTERRKLELTRGIAWFRMGDGSWTIATPSLSLEDFGTEFGVIVSPSGREEIHVFEGTVVATTRSGIRETLTAGSSRSTTPDGELAPATPRKDRFLKQLPNGLPVIHFSFDEMDVHLPVEGNHPDVPFIKARMTAGSPSPRLVPGRFGQALRFFKEGGHIETDWPGISGIAARTVTFWLKVDPQDDLTQLPAIASWGDPTVPNGKWKILLVQENTGGPAYPRISIGDHGYDAPVAANDGKWHHLAMSFSGRMGEDGHPELAIHLDGVRQKLTYRNFPDIYGIIRDPSFPREPWTRTVNGASPLEIGCFSMENFSGTFNGVIDELRIYPGLLPDEDIRKQAAGGE